MDDSLRWLSRIAVVGVAALACTGCGPAQDEAVSDAFVVVEPDAGRASPGEIVVLRADDRVRTGSGRFELFQRSNSGRWSATHHLYWSDPPTNAPIGSVVTSFDVSNAVLPGAVVEIPLLLPDGVDGHIRICSSGVPDRVCAALEIAIATDG